MGIIVGSVSVTVTPDVSKWDKELDAKLKNIKNVTVSIDLDTKKAEKDLKEFEDKKASSVNSELDLDTKKAKAQLDAFNIKLKDLSSKANNVNVSIKDKQATAQVLDLKAKLLSLGDKSSSPNITLAGMAHAEADLAKLDVALDKIGAKKVEPEVKVNTNNAEQDVNGLIDAAKALAPVLAPLGAVSLGGAVGLAGAFTAAGVGVGAFALAAVPAIKKVVAAEGALNTVVQSRTAAQKASLAGISSAEDSAAKSLLSFKQTYTGFTDALEPTVFTAMNGALGDAKSLLHDIAPIAHTTGGALVTLEGDLKKSLSTQYVKTFFDYLGVEAPKSITTFGRATGDIGLGFAGIIEAFTPVEHQLENGILHLSQKFADFGKGANTSSGLQSFMDYVEVEGPKVVHLVGQLGSTFADIAKDAAPIGAAELKIVSGLLGFVDAEAKAHPKLIEFALGIYSINKAVGLLKLGSLTGLGAAGGGAGLIGLGKGLTGIATGSKSVSEVFPKIGAAGSKAGAGLTAVGTALGTSEVSAAALTGGLGLLVGGLLIAQGYFSRGKLDADQYAASLAKAAGVAAPNGKDNTSNLFAYNDAITAVGNAKYQKTQTRNTALLTAGGASDVTGAAFATQARNVAALAAEQAKLTKQQKDTISGDNQMQASVSKLGNGFKLTGTQTAQLADKLGINLAVGFKTTAGMSDKMKAAVGDNVSKLQEYESEIKQSHDPTSAFSADIKQAGDATQSAAQQQTAFNNAITEYQDLTTATVTSAAQAGEAIKGLTGIFSKGTSAAGKNAAAATILSGNYKDLVNSGPQTQKFADQLGSLQSTFGSTYEQMFKTASEGGHTSEAFRQVTDAANVNKAALIKQLEAMGLNATEAKKLADKYAGVPKDITTKAKLEGVTDAENQAAGIKKKIDDIPLTKTSTMKAATATAQHDLDAWQTLINKLPKSARTTAELAHQQAETDLANLEQHIWDLTHKKWSVTINANGSVDIPNIRNGGGPVQAPAMADGGHVTGPGTGTSDSIHAKLSNGEFVVKASATAKHRDTLEAINSGKTPGFAAGGIINIKAATNAASLIPSVDGLTNDLKAAQKYAASLIVKYNAGAGVAQWAPLILKALAANGQPSSLLGTVERRMNQESGGNPNAINRTDINAQNGDPSRGLMQTIGSTFSAYHAPGTSNNIYDPFANIMASFRYAMARYGSLSAAFNRAGGYSKGGPIRGIGSGTSDSNLARVSNGEYVVNASSASRNRQVLDSINNGGTASSAQRVQNLFPGAQITIDSDTDVDAMGQRLAVILQASA